MSQRNDSCKSRLSFVHPHAEKEMSFEAPLPNAFQQALKILQLRTGLKFPRKGGQGAENLRKKNRHVHESETETNPARS